MRGLLRRVLRRRATGRTGRPARYPLLAKGETMDCSPLWPDGDQIPAILSPGRSTVLRPGETWVEAMRRLEEGEDL